MEFYSVHQRDSRSWYESERTGFYEQYQGKQAEKFAVSKDGGEGEPIDAISGATITSRAVTGAVNVALAYYQKCGLGGSEDE